MASSAVPENSQMNFNPSWMRSTSAASNVAVSAGKPTMNRVDAPALNVVQDYPLSEPIFVKNRYGREDLLALLPKDPKYPDGLQKCQFFVEVPQQPIVLTPLTDAETRLQHNINSSKAMSALSHAERTAIVSSNVMGQGNASASIGTTGSVSQASWTGGSGVGRGSGQGTRGGFGIFRGRGGQTLSAGSHASSVADGTGGSRYAYPRGRTSTTLGRGGSTATFNSRAQGLYDPRDPRDRPRQRVRSVSDDTTSPLASSAGNVATGQSVDDSSGNGWTQAPSRGNWRKFTPTGTSGIHQHNSVDSPNTNRSLMPEWMVDEQEKGPGLVPTRSGSFDENGQFRASDSGSPKVSTSSASGSILAKLSGAKDNKPPDAHVRTQASPRTAESVSISNPWNVISETPESRIDIGEQLAQQTQMSLLLPSAPLTRLASSDIFEAKMPEDVQVSQRPLVTTVTSTVAEDEWYYVDPGNSLQGPFPTSHMEAWFKSGYFTSNLNVRKGSGPNSHFQTLGELIQINGGTSPFRSKPVEPAAIVPVHLSLQSQTRELSSNPWTGEISESLFKVAKVEEQRQKLEEGQRRVAEKEKELKEMQEKLKRQEEERLMKVREMEIKLQKQQEELARREAEERKRAIEREREIEAERKRIAEEIERAKREELEKALAEQRKREEELRIAREREFEQMKAEAERLRCEKEKEEAARRAAEKAEEEARRLIALEEQKKKELEEREKERVRRAAEARKQASIIAASSTTSTATTTASATATTATITTFTANKIEVTEEYPPATKVKMVNADTQSSGTKTWRASYRVGEEKLITPKVAPWQSSTEEAISQSGKREKSLLEIQQEEERQLLAERKQRQDVSGNGRGNVASNTAAGGVWATSPQKLSWDQSGQLSRQASSPTTKSVAWGGAGLNQDARPTISVFFDGPSLESINKQSKKSASSPTKGAKASGKDSWQTASKQDSSRIEQETVKKLFKQSTTTNSSDGFTNWVIQRVKQLNSQVDADVLAEFIENVDSPDEVEDYIIGYLGDSIQVKEFIREFLAKRGDARLKKRAPIKDDLSGPAPAADPSLSSAGNGFGCSGGNSQQHAASGGKKKKKGKGGRLIVDGACLGFKGTADSNRVNIGEIATLSAMEVGHR